MEIYKEIKKNFPLIFSIFIGQIVFVVIFFISLRNYKRKISFRKKLLILFFLLFSNIFFFLLYNEYFQKLIKICYYYYNFWKHYFLNKYYYIGKFQRFKNFIFSIKKSIIDRINSITSFFFLLIKKSLFYFKKGIKFFLKGKSEDKYLNSQI